jgi:hypothetical protein
MKKVNTSKYKNKCSKIQHVKTWPSERGGGKVGLKVADLRDFLLETFDPSPQIPVGSRHIFHSFSLKVQSPPFSPVKEMAK